MAQVAAGGADRVARWRRVGAVAVAVEAALVLAGAVALAVHALTTSVRSEAVVSTANPRAVDIALSLGAVLLAAGLAGCSRGLIAGRAWARGPLLTWQLIQLGIAVQTLRGRAAMPMPTGLRWLAGLLLLLLGVLAVLGLTRSGLTAEPVVETRPAPRGKPKGGVRPRR